MFDLRPIETTAPPTTEREHNRTEALVTLLQLHWFLRLRWAFVVVALATLVLESFLAGRLLRPWGLAAVIVALALINLIWTALSFDLARRIRAPDPDEAEIVRRSLRFANAQVAVDLLLLTAILRYAGGVESPLALFYLFHMAIGSLLLRTWQAVLQGVWAVALYAALGLGEWLGLIRPHFDFLPGLDGDWFARGEYLAAVLTVFAVGVFGTLYFTVQIAARLDDREVRLRHALSALQQSNLAIHDLQARRSRFMQTAAHQLKSPLAGIRTLVDLIHDGLVPPVDLKAMCERIARRCQSGLDQVTELLALARIQEADPRRHGRTVADVRAIVLELIRQFAPQADAHRVRIENRIPNDLDLRVRVDPADLRDCLANLIDNAIKYTPGPGTVSLTAGAYVEDLPADAPAPAPRAGNGAPRFVWISVADTGMGIEPGALGTGDASEAVDSIFDAFRRGNNALSAGIPGSGLGLTIVREVVEQAGGAIRVHSRPGKGSTFTILLPSAGAVPARPYARNTRSSELFIESPPQRGALPGAPAAAPPPAETADAASNHRA